MPYKGRRQFSKKPTASEVVRRAPSTQGEVVIPPEYQPDILDQLCLLVMEGEQLDDICQREGMPSRSTVMRWLNRDPGFMDRYIKASQIRAFLDAERMQAIADDTDEDVSRSKLRVNTIQWRASKLLPNVYGDKVQQEHSIAGDLLKLLEGASDVGHKLPSEIE